MQRVDSFVLQAAPAQDRVVEGDPSLDGTPNGTNPVAPTGKCDRTACVDEVADTRWWWIKQWFASELRLEVTSERGVVLDESGHADATFIVAKHHLVTRTDFIRQAVEVPAQT